VAVQTAKLSLAERLSYGFGDMGTSLAYNMASGFLLFYYTNVVACRRRGSARCFWWRACWTR
jgi:GPH family glycoside/pentoside/hexuronide:cation symporter